MDFGEQERSGVPAEHAVAAWAHEGSGDEKSERQNDLALEELDDSDDHQDHRNCPQHGGVHNGLL